MRQVIVGCLGVTQLGGLVVYLCILLLGPPAKWHYRDITMHSVHFGGQELIRGHRTVVEVAQT